MLVLLYTDQGYAPGCYLLEPVSRLRRRRHKKATGAASQLFQADTEWPYLAQMLGWTGNDCDIDGATRWLDARDGHVFRVRECGYFDEGE